MLTTLAVVAAAVVGTMVGVEFAVAVFVNPILPSLNGLPTSPAQRDSHPVRVRRGCLPAGLTAVTHVTIR